MTKIQKATLDEKRQYDGIHPLYGYLEIGSHRCPVEYLGEGKDNPNYELLAPSGYQFIVNGTHTLLGFTLRDLYEQVDVDDLVRVQEEA